MKKTISTQKNRHVRKKKRRSCPMKGKIKKEDKPAKLGVLWWILLILSLLLMLKVIFTGGTYGYDYYPFRNLYNR